MMAHTGSQGNDVSGPGRAFPCGIDATSRLEARRGVSWSRNVPERRFLSWLRWKKQSHPWFRGRGSLATNSFAATRRCRTSRKLNVLREGLQSAEHAAFVAQLAQRRA